MKFPSPHSKAWTFTLITQELNHWANVQLPCLRRVLRRPRLLNTIREFFRALASLGGFLCRKCDGEPGWQTIWRGLDTLLQCLRGLGVRPKKCG